MNTKRAIKKAEIHDMSNTDIILTLCELFRSEDRYHTGYKMTAVQQANAEKLCNELSIRAIVYDDFCDIYKEAF